MPRRRHDSENGSESQDAGTFETLRDEGEHFVHVKQYSKAVESFSKALEMKADDRNCLVTRSKCYLQLGNAELALQDAEKALDVAAQDNQKFVKGYFQKAEALYQKGDFETALVYYHRGHKLRPELQEFRLGIQKCQEAINNSIGTPESVKLEAKGDLSFFYKQAEDAKAKAKKQQRGGYQKPIAKKEEKKERDFPKGGSDTKTVKQLLGEMYGDKDFLEKLLHDGSLTGNRNDKSREIKDRVCDGLEYLYSRADFWRQQKPMYARKRDRSDKTRDRSKTPMNAEKITKILEDIDDAQAEGRYQESLDKAKATIKLVDDASDDKIQNKPELYASLHSIIGNAYLELNKVNQSLDHHEKDLQISKENDLEDGQSRALDNLGRVYARKGDYDKAIDVWLEKVPTSKSALESTWLFHEIGRCYLEIGKFSEARDYGEKSLGAAKDADDEGWQLHACVLVAQSEVKLCEYQAAADSFEKSLEMAKAQNDGPAQEAIEKALTEVNNKIVQGVKEGDDKDDDDDDKDKGADKYDDDFEEEKEVSKKEKKQQKVATPPPKARTPTPPPATPPREKSPEPPHRKSVSIKEDVEEIPHPSPVPSKEKTEDEPAKPEKTVRISETPADAQTEDDEYADENFEETARSPDPSVEVEQEETTTKEQAKSSEDSAEVKVTDEESPLPEAESGRGDTQVQEEQGQQQEEQAEQGQQKEQGKEED